MTVAAATEPEPEGDPHIEVHRWTLWIGSAAVHRIERTRGTGHVWRPRVRTLYLDAAPVGMGTKPHANLWSFEENDLQNWVYANDLEALFFGPSGLLDPRPGCVVLTEEHFRMVRAFQRRPDRLPDYPDHDAVLAWMAWWMAWALQNTPRPAVYNR